MGNVPIRDVDTTSTLGGLPVKYSPDGLRVKTLAATDIVAPNITGVEFIQSETDMTINPHGTLNIQINGDNGGLQLTTEDAEASGTAGGGIFSQLADGAPTGDFASGGGITFDCGDGGAGASCHGGTVDITAGDGGGSSGTGGEIELEAGDGSGTGKGGHCDLFAGHAGATGVGGDLDLRVGDGGSTSGNAGNCTITGGDATSGTGSSMSIIGGAGADGSNSGDVILETKVVSGGGGDTGTVKFQVGAALYTWPTAPGTVGQFLTLKSGASGTVQELEWTT